MMNEPNMGGQNPEDWVRRPSLLAASGMYLFAQMGMVILSLLLNLAAYALDVYKRQVLRKPPPGPSIKLRPARGFLLPFGKGIQPSPWPLHKTAPRQGIFASLWKRDSTLPPVSYTHLDVYKRQKADSRKSMA